MYFPINNTFEMFTVQKSNFLHLNVKKVRNIFSRIASKNE